MRLGALVVVLVLLGCERRTTVDAGAKALAPELPWQPHGFREPTLKCELAVPEGLERTNPMPDHLVELRSAELPGLQLIEVIGRFPDEGGKAQLLQVVASLRCSKK